MTRTRALTAAVALVLALAGCGADSTGPTASATTPTLPACSAVFKPGQIIDQDKAQTGCLDPDGGVQAPGAHRCNDGRHLWQVDASTGATAGWGFGEGKYVAAKNAASDPAYSKAYRACTS